MQNYTAAAGGYLLDNNATTDCNFCSLSDTNSFLAQVNVYYKDRWRNFGIMWVYIIFNVCGAILLYYLARVPKTPKVEKDKKE